MSKSKIKSQECKHEYAYQIDFKGRGWCPDCKEVIYPTPIQKEERKKTGKLVGVCNCDCHCHIKCFTDHEKSCLHCQPPQPVESWEKEFEKTKFARGGGLSFEASDFEGMYTDLTDFIRLLLSQQKEQIRDEIESHIWEGFYNYGETHIDKTYYIDEKEFKKVIKIVLSKLK